jgi:hypothetical protein
MNYIVLLPIVITSLFPWQPQPTDKYLVEASVYIIEQTPEHVTGYKRTPCHEVRVDGSRVYSVVDPDVSCVQTLTKFDIIFNQSP